MNTAESEGQSFDWSRRFCPRSWQDEKTFSFSQLVGKPTFITAVSLWLSACSLKLKANSFKLPSYSVILSCSGSYWTVLSAVDRRVRYIMPVYFWTYCYDQSIEHNSSIMTNSLQKNSVAWVLPTASLFFLLVLQKFESIKCCALNPDNPEFYLLVIGMEGGGRFKGSQILLLWIISLCEHNEKNSIMKKIP